MKDEIKRNLAVLYEELGRKHIANNQDPQAVSAYIRASALDKNNSALASNLASLYQTRALAEPQPNQRIVLLNQSGEQWEIAGKAERDSQKRTEYLNQAALVYFTAATETKNLGDPSQYSRARQTLYAAQRVVTPQSDLAGQIQSLLTTLQ
jgi:Flp pilus assembly protein TadD